MKKIFMMVLLLGALTMSFSEIRNGKYITIFTGEEFPQFWIGEEKIERVRIKEITPLDEEEVKLVIETVRFSQYFGAEIIEKEYTIKIKDKIIGLRESGRGQLDWFKNDTLTYRVAHY